MRKIFGISLAWVLVLCLAGAALAGFIMIEDFTNLNAWVTETSGGGKKAEISGERYVPNGTVDRNLTSLKMVFPRADWDESSKGKRIEIRRQASSFTEFFVDRWYAVSIYVPEDNPEVGFHVLFQFHGNPDDPDDCYCGKGDCDSWRSPPFMLGKALDGTWTGQIRWSAQEFDDCGNESTTHITIPWRGEAPRVRAGSWTHWVFQVNWDWRDQGGGKFKAWLKDSGHPCAELVVDYSGPIGFNDTRSPYTKMGIYYSQDDLADWPPDVDELVYYFDRFLVANEYETLQDMVYEYGECADAPTGTVLSPLLLNQ